MSTPESAEAYRSLRSTLKFAAGDSPIRSVLVVDIDRDNNSGVAEKLAAAFSDAGDCCLLIDTNARHSGERSPGFSDLLSGSATVESFDVRPKPGTVAKIGPGLNGSPDALAGDAFAQTLATLVADDGFVIFSAATLPRYADALAIAGRVDAVILVVTAGGTRRPRAIAARDALDRVGANVLGVVMVEPKKRWFW